MHNHNPTDTYDRLTGGEKESTISGHDADNGHKQDKDVISSTDKASTLTSHSQPNATGSQQIAGNLLKVPTPPKREQQTSHRLQHPSSEYPPPAVFTKIDISAVVITESLPSNMPSTLDAHPTKLALTITNSYRAHPYPHCRPK